LNLKQYIINKLLTKIRGKQRTFEVNDYTDDNKKIKFNFQKTIWKDIRIVDEFQNNKSVNSKTLNISKKQTPAAMYIYMYI